MALKMKTKKEQFWVKMDEDGNVKKVDSTYQMADNEGMFFVSPLDAGETYDLLDEAVEHEWDNNQRFDKPNWFGLSVRKVQKIILDWKGMTNANGEVVRGVAPGDPVPCDDYWKEQLYKCNQPLFRALFQWIDDYQLRKKKAQEDSLGNLSSGQSGTSDKTEASPTAESAEK